MASALEQSLIDLVAQHDLVNIDFGLMAPSPARQFFGASVQWEVDGERRCASGNGDTIAHALGSAITTMQVKRGIVASTELPDEPLIAEAA